MSRKFISTYKQLIAAGALAIGAAGTALADDSSMSPFTGDSYRYFNGGHTLLDGAAARPAIAPAADPTWRQSHPDGFADRELQALSSSSLSASAQQIDPPQLTRLAADPMWRQSHPNGLSERDFEALSSSTLAVWQPANGMTDASAYRANVAQTPAGAGLFARVAKAFRAGGASRTSTN